MLAGAQQCGGPGPCTQKIFDFLPLGGRKVEGSKIRVRLGWRNDATLMHAPEGLCCLGRLGARTLGDIKGAGRARRKVRAGSRGQSRGGGEKAPARSPRLGVFGICHFVAFASMFTSSST